jgi:hypothetical protein
MIYTFGGVTPVVDNLREIFDPVAGLEDYYNGLGRPFLQGTRVSKDPTRRVQQGVSPRVLYQSGL